VGLEKKKTTTRCVVQSPTSSQQTFDLLLACNKFCDQTTNEFKSESRQSHCRRRTQTPPTQYVSWREEKKEREESALCADHDMCMFDFWDGAQCWRVEEEVALRSFERGNGGIHLLCSEGIPQLPEQFLLKEIRKQKGSPEQVVQDPRLEVIWEIVWVEC